MCDRECGGVVIGVMDGVVIHVGPNQSFEFEDAPHSSVRVADFAADGFMSSGFSELLESGFNFIGGVEIETGARGRRDGDHLARLVGRQEFAGYSFDFFVRPRSI